MNCFRYSFGTHHCLRWSHCLYLEWHVRWPQRPRRWKRYPHHHPTHRRWCYCPSSWRTPQQGIRTRLWYFPLHRHQHLRNHRLEIILTNHRSNRPRCWIRRIHHCSLPPPYHQTKQDRCSPTSLLQNWLAKHQQPFGHCSCFLNRHLLPST